jgi:WD40 repeat protein
VSGAPSIPRCDAFLSYRRREPDRAFARKVIRRLEAAGLRVAIDERDFSPEASFVEEMERWIRNSRFTLAVISSRYLESGNTIEEAIICKVLDLRERRHRLIPLIMEKVERPAWLYNIVGIDFTDPDPIVDPFQRLVGALKALPPVGGSSEPRVTGSRTFQEALPTMSGVTSVPKSPPHFLPRPEVLARLKEMLLREESGAVGITGTGVVGVQGMGGIGKTVLAAKAATEVAANFPDGVFWVRMGQRPKLTKLQIELAAAGGESGLVFESPHQGKLFLQRLFAERKALLVLDDAWSLDEASALDVVGPRSRLLITTRDARVLVGLGAEELTVSLLSPPQALQLLADWAGQSVGNLPSVAKRVAEACGYLPLGLAMVGAMVRLQPTGWPDALQRLESADLERLKRNFPDYPYPDLLRALAVSVEALEPEERDRYLEAAVFPEDAKLPEAVFETLWAPAGLSPEDARELVASFAARSLLARNRTGSVSLHDLQVSYLRKEVANPAQLHGLLVDAYAAKCPRGFATSLDDGYLFEHLPAHMAEAGRAGQLEELLSDFRWLEVKLAATDVNALISDFDLLPGNGELRPVQRALRLSSHIVALSGLELAGQLHGRLSSEGGGVIGRFLSGVRTACARPWLRPLTRSLEPHGALVRVLQSGSPRVRAVALLPDGRVVSGSESGELRVWDVISGKMELVLAGHSREIQHLAVLPDGDLVSGSKDETIRVWNVATGETRQVLSGYGGSGGMAVLPGDRIVSSGDGAFRVWDIATGEGQDVRSDGHTWDAELAVLANGSHVVSSATYQPVCVWDVATGKTIQQLRGHSARVGSVAVLPDGHVVTGSWDTTIRIWDVNSGETLRVLSGHSAEISALAVLPGGRLVSASLDRTLRVWDVATGKVLHILAGHLGWVLAIATLRSGCIISGSDDGSVRVWDVGVRESDEALSGHTGWVLGLAEDTYGRIVSASFDGTLRVWDGGSGETTQVLAGHSAGVNAVAALADGRIVSASDDATLRIWDIATGAVVQVLSGHSHRVSALSVLADRRIISSAADRTLRIWNLETGGTAQILRGDSDWAVCLAALPNGRIISGSDDGKIRVWDIATGKVLLKLSGHPNWVRCVAVLPDGDIVSGAEDHTVRVWNLDRGEVFQARHPGWVLAVAALPDGRIVSGCDDGTVRVWDLVTKRVVAQLTLDSRCTALAFGSKQRALIVGDALGRVHVLKLEE